MRIPTSIRKTIRNCFIVIVIALTFLFFLMVIGPAVRWSISAFKGEITLGSIPQMTFEDILTYSISALTLLVTIITIVIGLFGIIGYSQIRDAAEKKAEESAKRTITDMEDTLFKEMAERLYVQMNINLQQRQEEKEFDNVLAKRIENNEVFSKIINESNPSDNDLLEKLKESFHSDHYGSDK